MKGTINPAWKAKIIKLLDDNEDIEETTHFTMAIQWLVLYLTQRGKEFKVYNIGAGVKTITTKIDTCPMCKRKLNK